MRSIWQPVWLMLCCVTPVHADLCMDEAVAQTDINRCAADASQASDAELDRVYREIEQRLGGDESTRQLLVAAQRAWLALRDAECAFASSAVQGGSVHPMVRDQCLDGMTRARVAALRPYLDCREGDLGCPVPQAD